MTSYRVVWVIDVGASSPREAAIEAMRCQVDGDSTANCFTVFEGGPDAGVYLGSVIEPEEIDLGDGPRNLLSGYQGTEPATEPAPEAVLSALEQAIRDTLDEDTQSEINDRYRELMGESEPEDEDGEPEEAED